MGFQSFYNDYIHTDKVYVELGKSKRDARDKLITGHLSQYSEEEINRLMEFSRKCVSAGALCTAKWIREGFSDDSKSVSIEKVTRSMCIAAIDSYMLTNCLTEIRFDLAIREAEILDEKKAYGSSPVYGIPITVKDNFNLAGFDSTLGIARNIGIPAIESAALIQDLESYGCIVIAKTSVPQTMLTY